jgi:alpha-galactosidase
VFDAFGLFPIPGDEHLCEYMPWVSDPITQPWQKYDLELYEWQAHSQGRDEKWLELIKILETRANPEAFIPPYSEGALEVIENIHSDGGMYWEALNIPNAGYIPNLPEGSIVELPGTLNANGAIGRQIGALPEGIAELIRREISISHLTVDSVVAGDRQLALQALLLDPVIRDMDLAKLILDDYLTVYRQYLPTFWK